MKLKPLNLAWFFLLSACASGGSLDFSDVVGIPPSDGAGTALSGTFSVLMEIKSNNCDSSDLQTPSKGTSIPLDVEVTQEDGSVELQGLELTLRGGISFQNVFEAGGAEIASRGDEEENILRTILIEGEYQTSDQFTASGDERLVGSINQQNIDCIYSFELTGVRRE